MLWTAISAVQARCPRMPVTVYIAAGSKSDEAIVHEASSKFSLEIKGGIRFIRLRSTDLMRDWMYPRLTLVLQAIGTMLVGLEAVVRHRPALVLDTIGAPSAYPCFYLAGSRIQAYVHYPLISSDMMGRVGAVSAAAGSRCQLLGMVRLAYYRALYGCYRLCGLLVETAMVNSRWTEAHMRAAWPRTRIGLVFPPCDVQKFCPPPGGRRNKDVVSLSQFRPEKNHLLQLEAFRLFTRKHGQWEGRLIMAGGCRDAADRQRVAELRLKAQELGMGERVVFEVDVPFERIQELLWTSSVGLHTMVDEHFGISVVEFMAAGLLTIANNSGGPKSDIVDARKNGCRASTAADYAAALAMLFALQPPEAEAMRRAARKKAVEHFACDRFERSIVSYIKQK